MPPFRWRPRPFVLVMVSGLLLVAVDQLILRMLDSKTGIALWELGLKAFEFVLVLVGLSLVPKWRGGSSLPDSAVVEEMVVSREKLEESEKLTMIGVLAAGIAHEIRNPLTSLRGFVQLLQAKGTEYTGIMLNEIDRINGIVSELLLIAKPKETQHRETGITGIVEQTVAFLIPQATMSDVILQCRFEPGVSAAVIRCDENKIKQVLINVIKNAIEAMPGGGTVYITAACTETEVTVSIRDTGVGIGPELLEQLGSAFSSTKEEGTGLGLMISGSIVSEHGGVMRFDSRPGEGTTVEIALPRATVRSVLPC